MLVFFRRGRDDGLRQFVVLPQSLRQLVATVLQRPCLVVCPQRSGGAPCHICSHDELDRQGARLPCNGHIGVWDVHEVVGADVRRACEPPGCHRVEHCPFERHLAQYTVKGRQSVRGDDDHLVLMVQGVHIPHLAATILAHTQVSARQHRAGNHKLRDAV